MNIVKLYEQTPVERHSSIKVEGNQIFIQDAEGNAILEYFIDAEGELVPVYSVGKVRKEILAIKDELKTLEDDLKIIKGRLK